MLVRVEGSPERFLHSPGDCGAFSHLLNRNLLHQLCFPAPSCSRVKQQRQFFRIGEKEYIVCRFWLNQARQASWKTSGSPVQDEVKALGYFLLLLVHVRKSSFVFGTMASLPPGILVRAPFLPVLQLRNEKQRRN